MSSIDHEHDLHALSRMASCRPAWNGVYTAAEAFGLTGKRMLHSGPPVDSPQSLVVPTLHSAAVACVYEGWAPTLAEGLALVRSGDVTFSAAQDHGAATPMAAVVSPSMRMLGFTDLDHGDVRGWAPINGGGTGGDPAPRYGRCTDSALEHLRFLNGPVADLLAATATEPLEWLPIVDEALLDGDDLHLRHVAAHGRLCEHLRRRAGALWKGVASDFIEEWPIFHLNFWMAAARCALGAASGVKGSALVTAMGGNGERFGLQVSGLPGQWFTCEATPPQGKVREPYTLADCVGAYGDSALVEAFGLGAMAHSYCPDMQAFHADFYFDDLLDLPEMLLLAPHPLLPRSGARIGLSASRVVRHTATPIVELGIVHDAGIDGGLGAGLYRPSITPFVEAVAALSKEDS